MVRINIINKEGESTLAKAGMRRPDPGDPKAHGTESYNKQNFPHNTVNPVPEIQGNAKTGNKKAGPVGDPLGKRKH